MSSVDVSRVDFWVNTERIRHIQYWSNWFYANTESFHGGLGVQLAYLWPAIACGGTISAYPTSPLVRLLREKDVDTNATIWHYINVETN